MNTPLPNPILVTGATGFIGRALVEHLLREGHIVRALVVPEEQGRTGWQGTVQETIGDVRNRESVEKAAAGVKTIFHLAAIATDAGSEQLHHQVTVEGTGHVLLAAASAGAQVVLTSSVTVYGTKIQTEVLTEDLPWGPPAGRYGKSKQAQERLAWQLARENNTALTVIRPGNVWGPHSKLWVDGVLAELRRGTPALLGGGDFNAGLCHVQNLVDLLVLAASSPAAQGRAFNAADDADITWKRYFSDLAALSGAPQPRSIPRWLAKMLAAGIEPAWRLFSATRPPLTFEAYNLVGSDHRFPITRAKTELGYVPRIDYPTGLAGVRDYLNPKG